MVAASTGYVVAAEATNAKGLGRYIVVFDTAVNEAAKDALMRKFGGTMDKPIELLGNANVVLLPPQAVAALLSTGLIERMEEDVIFQICVKPQPPSSPAEILPWGVDRINAIDVWTTSRGLGVKVAVIDTGIDIDHPDLASNIAGGCNFVVVRGKVNPTKYDDDNGHGTHVAGTIAGIDNEIGVIGVAPEASLYAVKVLNKSGSGYVSDIVLGIQWAISNGMDVINMSLGSSYDVDSLRQACDAAYEAGIVVVAAAGNSGDTDSDNDVIYPARYASVIAVAATDLADMRTYWSSDGPEVELAAPGAGIYSTYKGGGYSTLSGTSMATPHVAGTVALMLGTDDFSPDEVRLALTETAIDLGDSGRDNYYGYGLINAQAAVSAPP
jgi:subtilisin family serine protease